MIIQACKGVNAYKPGHQEPSLWMDISSTVAEFLYKFSAIKVVDVMYALSAAM